MRTSLQVRWRIQQVTSIDSRKTQEESANETYIAPIVAAVLGFPVGLLAACRRAENAREILVQRQAVSPSVRLCVSDGPPVTAVSRLEVAISTVNTAMIVLVKRCYRAAGAAIQRKANACA